MLKALIFDVDGTLAETEEAHRAAFNQAFFDAGMDWHWSMETYRILLRTTGGKERMRAHQLNLPADKCLSDNQIAELHKKKTALYGKTLASGALSLRPGVADLIETARDAGLKIAVATTTNLPNVEALAQCCWGRVATEIFDVIAAGDQVASKKPAPDVFQLALTRLGLPADQCIGFEDSLNGVQSARAAGLRVVVTPSIYTDDQDFSAAQLLRPSLTNLTLATLAGL